MANGQTTLGKGIPGRENGMSKGQEAWRMYIVQQSLEVSV